METQYLIKPQQNYLLFDGACGICYACAQFAQRRDRRRQFQIVPYQQIPETELLRYGTSYAKCSRRVHVISRQGKVYAGAFAVNYFLRHYFPWNLLVAAVYLVPLFLLLEMLLYALVAHQRRRLSQWLGFTACVMLPQKSQA
ncbi:DUF393 domain-containing protein [candidate division KSB1 bacterium]|nr:DUF393 domain-containing protein [candidate division KSB1 bacterium]